MSIAAVSSLTTAFAVEDEINCSEIGPCGITIADEQHQRAVGSVRVAFHTPFLGTPTVRLHPVTPGIAATDITPAGFTLRAESVPVWRGSYEAIYTTTSTTTTSSTPATHDDTGSNG